MSAHEMLHHGWQFGQVLKFGEGPLSGARGGRPRLPAHCFSGQLFRGWPGPPRPQCTSTDFRNGGGRCRRCPRHGGRRGHRAENNPSTGLQRPSKRQTLLDRFPPPTSRFATCSQTPCGKREMRFTSPRPRANGCTAWRIAPRLGGCRMRRSLMIGQRKHFARGHCNELNARGEGMDHGASKPRHGLISDRQRARIPGPTSLPWQCRLHSKNT